MTANRDPDDDHRVTTDPETVEEWAAEYDVVPVEPPGEEPKVRFLPQSAVEREMSDHERLEWTEVHSRFERGEFALVDRGEGEEGWQYELLDRTEVTESIAGKPPDDEPTDREPSGDEFTDPGRREPAESEPAASAEPTSSDEPTGTTEPTGTAEPTGITEPTSTTERPGGDRTVPKPRDQGKDVLDASGQRIGMVADVRGDTLYVDPHPSLTGRIKAALDWGEMSEDAFAVQPESIRRIYTDVVLDVERPGERK